MLQGSGESQHGREALNTNKFIMDLVLIWGIHTGTLAGAGLAGRGR